MTPEPTPPVHSLLNCYALVDCEKAQDIPPEYEQHSLALVSPLAENADMLPTLVSLGAHPDGEPGALLTQQSRSIANDAGPWFLTCLASPADAETLQHHLARLQLVYSRPSLRCAWLRLHDPMVLPQLYRIFKDITAWGQIMGPVNKWHLLSKEGWVFYRNPGTYSGIGKSLYLDAGHWGALERIGVINRALLHYRIFDKHEILPVSEKMDAMLQRGQKDYQLQQPDELFAFLTWCWDIHPQFDKHPALQKLLKEWANSPQKAQDATAVEVFERMTAEDKIVLRNDLLSGYY